MGLDMQLQALPDNEDWWNAILADQGIRENLSLLPAVLHEGGHLPTTGEVGQLATALIAAHPGIEKRNCNLGRLWDVFAYLLSRQRRDMVEDEEVDTSDLGLIAVRGQHSIGWEGEEVCGFQGIPLGFTEADIVRQIAGFLAARTDDELQTFFVPEAMEGVEVYQNPGVNEWDEIRNTFHKLQRFYHNAAAHGEGVLVCLD